MKKTYNKRGNAAFVIKTTHIVSLSVFANALAMYCWNAGTIFDPNMKKTEAMRILKESLFQYGLQGSDDLTRYEGASDEAVAGYDKALPLTIAWVEKNYPYLSENYYDGK